MHLGDHDLGDAVVIDLEDIGGELLADPVACAFDLINHYTHEKSFIGLSFGGRGGRVSAPSHSRNDMAVGARPHISAVYKNSAQVGCCVRRGEVGTGGGVAERR
ncbi:hypothetical protein GCM10010458_02090 [Microbacterium luteolum]